MMVRPGTANGERKNRLWACAATRSFPVVSVGATAANGLCVHLAAYPLFGFIHGMRPQGGLIGGVGPLEGPSQRARSCTG